MPNDEPPADYTGPLAKKNDPATSHEAGRKIRRKLGKHHKRTFECVLATPGMTARELAEHHKFKDIRDINRRLSECVKLGLIRIGETRPCLHTGHKAMTWYPVDQK